MNNYGFIAIKNLLFDSDYSALWTFIVFKKAAHKTNNDNDKTKSQ